MAVLSRFPKKGGFNTRLLPVLIATWFFYSAHALVNVVLPLYAKSFNVSYTLVGLAVSAFAISRIFLDIPGGSITDRFGEKKTMALGMAIFAVSAIPGIFATSITHLIISRLLEGVSGGMFTVAGQTYAGAIGGEGNRARNLFWFYASAGLGSIATSVIGGIVAELLGYGAVYVLLGVLSLIAMVFILIEVPDIGEAGSRARPSIATTFRIISGAFKDRMMIVAQFLAAITFLVMTGIPQTAFPLHAQLFLKMSLADIGLVASISSIAAFLAQVGVSSLLFKMSRRTVFFYSFLSNTILIYLFVYAGDPTTLSALRIAYGVPSAILGPLQAAFSMDFSDSTYRGSYTAINRVFNDVGYIAGPLLIGAIFDQLGLNAVYILMSVICATGVLFSIFIPKAIKPKDNSSVA